LFHPSIRASSDEKTDVEAGSFGGVFHPVMKSLPRAPLQANAPGD